MRSIPQQPGQKTAGSVADACLTMTAMSSTRTSIWPTAIRRERHGRRRSRCMSVPLSGTRSLRWSKQSTASCSAHLKGDRPRPESPWTAPPRTGSSSLLTPSGPDGRSRWVATCLTWSRGPGGGRTRSTRSSATSAVTSCRRELMLAYNHPDERTIDVPALAVSCRAGLPLSYIHRILNARQDTRTVAVSGQGRLADSDERVLETPALIAPSPHRRDVLQPISCETSRAADYASQRPLNEEPKSTDKLLHGAKRANRARLAASHVRPSPQPGVSDPCPSSTLTTACSSPAWSRARS